MDLTCPCSNQDAASLSAATAVAAAVSRSARVTVATPSVLRLLIHALRELDAYPRQARAADPEAHAGLGEGRVVAPAPPAVRLVQYDDSDCRDDVREERPPRLWPLRVPRRRVRPARRRRGAEDARAVDAGLRELTEAFARYLDSPRRGAARRSRAGTGGCGGRGPRGDRGLGDDGDPSF